VQGRNSSWFVISYQYMDKYELAILRYGEVTPPPRTIELRAGALQCKYSRGVLRQVKAGDSEVLRMIYAAVRDQYWNTINPVVLDESVKKDNDSFHIKLSCEYIERDIHFRAEYSITGGSNNRISFSMEGVAESTFLMNRIGLCLLHPLKECAGRACEVVTTQGERVTSTFPRDISPYQPMKNIRSLKWTIPGGAVAQLHFEGDTFEMEDQRNWTDASYKTYSTPLEKPFPAKIRKGDRIRQRIVFELSGMLPSGIEQGIHVCSVSFDMYTKGYAFPDIGLNRSGEQRKLTARDRQIITRTGFDHYRLELCLFKPGWRDELKTALAESSAMKLPLELALYISKDYDREVKELLENIRDRNPVLSRLMIFTENHIHSPAITNSLIPLLKRELGNIPAGTGTDANFAELNRNRPDTSTLDFITFAVCPQVHATDCQTLFENLEGQAEVVKSARSFAQGRDICISAVTLKKRFSKGAAAVEPVLSGQQLRAQTDTRQVSLLCAAWTLGSIKYLGEQNVRSVSYYETTGRMGVIHGDCAPLTPALFHAARNDLYPVWFLFRELLRYKNWEILPSECSDPLVFTSMILRKDYKFLLALANSTGKAITVECPHTLVLSKGWFLDAQTLGKLRQGENSWRDMSRIKRIRLLPFGIALIEA
jgi:hypothetical protein